MVCVPLEEGGEMWEEGKEGLRVGGGRECERKKVRCEGEGGGTWEEGKKKKTDYAKGC